MNISSEAKKIIEDYIEDIEGNYFDEITRVALTKYGPSVFEEVIKTINEIGINADRGKYIKSYYIEDGVVYTADKSILLKYDINKSEKDFIIPSTVEYVASEAFKGATALERVFVPQTVKKVNSKAWLDRSKLAVSYGKTVVCFN